MASSRAVYLSSPRVQEFDSLREYCIVTDDTPRSKQERYCRQHGRQMCVAHRFIVMMAKIISVTTEEQGNRARGKQGNREQRDRAAGEDGNSDIELAHEVRKKGSKKHLKK